MTWWQASAVVPTAQADAVAWLLAEALDLPVEVQDADTLIDANDAASARVVVGLTEPPDAALQAAFGRALSTLGVGDAAIETRRREDTDWQTGWRAFFVPLRLSPRFAVRPPWAEPEHAVPHPLIIDPGMAFGTGSHATTRGVIRALDAVLADRAPLRVLDVGTGSGILAIAAARLGHSVIGVEPDTTALENAARNVALNGVADRLELVAGSAADVPGRFDVVIANIIAPVLVAIAPAITARCGGEVLLSGLLVDQEAEVRDAYPGLRAVERWTEGEWVVLRLRSDG